MKFSTTMFQLGNNTGIEVPEEIVLALGAGKRPPVNVNVNGFEYRSTVAPMGGTYLIPFSAERRRASGIQGGDAIEVELTLDTAPRTVETPADFAAALDADPAAKAAYEKLSPSAKKAQVTNIESAKAAATRQRRIETIVAKLHG